MRQTTAPAVCGTGEARPSSPPLVCLLVVCSRRRAKGNERARRAFVHDGCPNGVGHVECDACGLLSPCPSHHVIRTRRSHSQHTCDNMHPFRVLETKGTKGTRKRRKEQDGRNAPAKARQSCRRIGRGAGRWLVHATRHLRTLLPPPKRARSRQPWCAEPLAPPATLARPSPHPRPPRRQAQRQRLLFYLHPAAASWQELASKCIH